MLCKHYKWQMNVNMANESQQAHHVHQFSDLLQLLQYESNCMSPHTGIEHNSITKLKVLSILNPVAVCVHGVPLSSCT